VEYLEPHKLKCAIATSLLVVFTLTVPTQHMILKFGTKLWQFLQAIGATVGAYLVQHLEPHNLQFAIATSLLVVFILMVTPLAKLLKRWQESRAPGQGIEEPLLSSSDAQGVLTLRYFPGPSQPSMVRDASLALVSEYSGGIKTSHIGQG